MGFIPMISARPVQPRGTALELGLSLLQVNGD